MADQEGGGIFISPLNRGDIGQFQRSAPGNNRRVADLLQAVERPVEADKDLPPRVSIAPAAVSTFWLFSAAKIASGERPRVARRS